MAGREETKSQYGIYIVGHLHTKGRFLKSQSNPNTAAVKNVICSGHSKSFAEVLKGKFDNVSRGTKKVSTSFIYESSSKENMKFTKAKVGITSAPGLTYGVNQSLIEEGIFTVITTSLGPNLYLLEELVDGDLNTLLEDEGEWINHWFKEVRNWKATNVECARVAWISIYGIPFHVRNERFIDCLFWDIGKVASYKYLKLKSDRLDVHKLMAFTEELEPIKNKLSICLNGSWLNIMLIKEVQVHVEEPENTNGGASVSSNNSGSEFYSEFGNGGVEGLKEKGKY